MPANDPQQAPAPNARHAFTWRRYLRFWGARPDADVDDELQFHIDMRTRDFMARGMTEADARAEAMRRLGNLANARASSLVIARRRERREGRTMMIDAFVHDLRFAFRTLGRRKAWTAVAVLTLAMGIGANTAVFSVVDALLLHPIPYPHADRVVFVMEQPSQANNTGVHVTISPAPQTVKSWRASARSFEDIEPYSATGRTLEFPGGSPALVRVASVLPSFSRFAEQRAIYGREFSAADVDAGGHVVLLAEDTWRRRFGADSAVLGKPLLLDGQSYTVIGVMSAGLTLPRTYGAQRVDFWAPLDLNEKRFGANVVARLRPGVDFGAAARELDSIDARSGIWGKSKPAFTNKLVKPAELVDFRDSLLLLSGAVALVLLIACANVAHLVLAAAAARQRELAIRASLGAGTARLFRQMLTESLVLALGGCAVGILAGWAGLHAVVALRPEDLRELGSIGMSGETLAFTAALCVLTAVVFGAIGVVQAARHSTHDALKAGATSASQGRRQHRLRATLVVSEMALSTVLLVGAALLIRTVVNLQRQNPGFEPANLYTLEMDLPPVDSAAKIAGRRAMLADVVRRVRGVNGVRNVTLADGAPPYRSFTIGALEIEGEAPPPPGTSALIGTATVESNYFSTLGMRFVQGGTFVDTLAPGDVIVNEGFARKHWPAGTAVGRRLRVGFPGGPPADWMRIVGVVRDAAAGMAGDPSEPMLYERSVDHIGSQILVRAREGFDPTAALRAIGQQAAPHKSPPDVVALTDVIKNSIAGPRFTMFLLALFTAIAVVLAAIGLYGVLAYSVAQRTREIGIRVALGASRRRIARSIVSDGVRLAVIGVVIGGVVAVWATKLVASMLHGVERTDPTSFLLGALVLLATAVIACIVPVRRAVTVDPSIAMRSE